MGVIVEFNDIDNNEFYVSLKNKLEDTYSLIENNNIKYYCDSTIVTDFELFNKISKL